MGALDEPEGPDFDCITSGVRNNDKRTASDYMMADAYSFPRMRY
jgi:hypothetical protein